MFRPVAAVVALVLAAVVADAAPRISREAADAYAALDSGDAAKARERAEPLAAAGDPAGLTLLAYLDERGLAGPKNLPRALENYVAAANAGYADAQFALGELAYHGDGVKKDLARAAGWFELAAEQGQPRASVRLGQMLMTGEGVVKDPVRGAKLLETGARAGDPDGLFYAGVAALNGAGRPQNYADALADMRKAAEQGHALAAYNLALLYDSDLAGPADPVAASQWMTRAADAGLAQAMVGMGLIAHREKIAAPSAADWFEKAAKAGDPQGQFLFAVALSEGDGRPADARAALRWVDRALVSADEMDPELKADAEALRKKLVSGLAPKPAMRN